MSGLIALATGNIETQLKFGFGLYDLDGNGSINADEVSRLLHDGLECEDENTMLLVNLVAVLPL